MGVSYQKFQAGSPDGFWNYFYPCVPWHTIYSQTVHTLLDTALHNNSLVLFHTCLTCPPSCWTSCTGWRRCSQWSGRWQRTDGPFCWQLSSLSSSSTSSLLLASSSSRTTSSLRSTLSGASLTKVHCLHITQTCRNLTLLNKIVVPFDCILWWF